MSRPLPPHSRRFAARVTLLMLAAAPFASADYGPTFTHGRGAQGEYVRLDLAGLSADVASVAAPPKASAGD